MGWRARIAPTRRALRRGVGGVALDEVERAGVDAVRDALRR